ncbi:macro domain-containing protein [Ruminococcaceae bacterium OttesenSCG-928-D13]|nr:macro domain-containing protein [Ruminococcaceae bacterium OttesenSCG-928-D13]
MPFNIVRNDITKMNVDAIVNAANTELQMGGGVCGAIFKAAGAGELKAACDKLAPIQTGAAVITPGFQLPAKHIIHTAGPVYKDGRHGEAELLRACYMNSLELAAQHGCEFIAFPLISSGIYGYPKEEALHVATTAIHDYLASHDMDIYLIVFDKVAFSISKKLLGSVESYIDQHYVDEHLDTHRRRNLLDVERSELFTDEILSEVISAPDMAAPSMASGPPDIVRNLDEPFAQTLLRLIDAKGKTDAEVYKLANIDRRLFSKIRSGKGYMPSKRTIIALAIALELTLSETEDLLKRAGFALSRSQKADVIIEYFLVNRKYDIFEINEVLFHYDQPLLGG